MYDVRAFSYVFIISNATRSMAAMTHIVLIITSRRCAHQPYGRRGVWCVGSNHFNRSKVLQPSETIKHLFISSNVIFYTFSPDFSFLVVRVAGWITRPTTTRQSAGSGADQQNKVVTKYVLFCVVRAPLFWGAEERFLLSCIGPCA